MKPEPIQEPQDPQALPTVSQILPGWQVQAALPQLCREFEFGDFSAAVNFVGKVARLAIEQQHYPEIDLRYNRVTLRLTTPEHGGVSHKDEALGRAINRLHRK